MNAVETIQAAIMRLEEVKTNSTPGPWEGRLYDGVRDAKSRLVRVVEPENEYGYDRVVSLADYLSRENADMIVTLHRTLDSQLAILRDGLTQAEAIERQPNYWYAEPKDGTLALANAILGGAE